DPADLPKIEGELVIPELAAEAVTADGEAQTNKILAQAGLSSRRGADRLIADGRIAVNGAVARELGTLADPQRDVITVDGRPLPRAEAQHYLGLHKPASHLTTVRDPRGPPLRAHLGT